MKISRISTLLAGGASVALVDAQQSAWGQCGGSGWTGPTTCVSGYVCTYSNAWYSQCLVGTATSSTTATTSTKTSSSTTSVVSKTSSTKITTSSSSSKATTSTTLVTSSTSVKTTSTTTSAASSTSGAVKYAGINIAGFDFGVGTDGSQTVANVQAPVKSISGIDGIGQMQHFVTDDKLNAFRLPVGWQFLVNSVLGGTLNAANLAEYDLLVQGCLATGAVCIIDIHNYARWNGAIIGQGGPTNAQFTNLWSQLAAKYASQSNIIFGVMNEPHDLTISTWATTVQAAVTAIRGAGATSQIILLPGNDWTHGSSSVSDGSAAALAAITNPDGTTTNLVFDIHEYLDSNNSGTDSECVTSNVSAWATLVSFLRTNKRQAFLSETGGGNTASCITYLCQEIAYLNANSDVFLGYTGWAAGSFSATTYTLTETPTLSGSTWTDQSLVKACLAR